MLTKRCMYVEHIKIVVCGRKEGLGLEDLVKKIE